MKKMVPIAKQSKRAQREHNREKRGDWGAVKPVLRIVESRKKYRRERQKAHDHAEIHRNG